MKLSKWTLVVVFDAREADDYIKGYVNQYERVLKLQEDMERLVLQRGNELDFRQFYRLSDIRCGVAHSEVDPKEVKREARFFSLQVP